MSQRYFSPLNFASLDPPYSEKEKAQVVILPVPYDGTVEWQCGVRNGPQAILEASRYLELYDIELGRETYDIGIHTMPLLEPVLSGPEHMIQRVYKLVRGMLDRIVIMLGGEHSLTLGMVKAYREKFKDLCVLHFDAHADLRDCYLGAKFGQATVMRRVYELCPLISVGIRSMCQEERQFIDKSNIIPVYSHELISGKVTDEQIVERLTSQVYITVDLDVLDPSIMPAVSTPEPGGISWYYLLSLLRKVNQSRQVVGFDVVELCPDKGSLASAYIAAKLVYKMIGYIYYM